MVNKRSESAFVSVRCVVKGYMLKSLGVDPRIAFTKIFLELPHPQRERSG